VGLSLQTTHDQLDATQSDLDKARLAYSVQTEALDARVCAMYLSGNTSAIEILLYSRSFNDFFARIHFLKMLNDRDSGLAGQLANQRNEIEEDKVEIDGARIRAEALEFDLTAKQIEILTRIEERQYMLLNAQTDLVEFLEEEAERRRLEQDLLMTSILAGTDDIGIEVIEGGLVETVLSYHGIPYLWGGETPAGFDCSGLVTYVFRQHGITLPHYSGSQFMLGERILPPELLPGDVVFFGTPVHHVGIYLGSGYYIHAPRTGEFVKISLLSERIDYAGARRYDWMSRTGPVALSGATDE